ncbi:MAG TPA: phosphate acyltransferase PlsX [Firmicutes bacterium]|nr:phosphate acyltransferase PlsX [Bacillota bacterium]
MRVAVDAMGGDYAPAEIIKGTIMALQAEEELHVSLVGRDTILNEQLAAYEYPSDRLSIVTAAEVIGNNEPPALALRRKKDASMLKAISLVKEKEAHAAISAGNTGALMVGGLLILGRVRGIDRPALAITLPSVRGGKTVLLDVGANMDASVENLRQYALLGKVYAEKVLGKDNVRIGLLNIGAEPGKGNELVKKAYTALEKEEGFAGNVEARDLLQGLADVVVCEGFVGNILLKTLEGTAAEIFAFLKQEINRNWRGKVGGALLVPAFKQIKKRMDYAEYGGSPLLGINGLVIKAHGSSKAKSIKSTILNQACPFVRQGCIEKINNLFEAGRTS